MGTTRAPHRRMPKRSKQETRELMLRAAVDLLRATAAGEGNGVVAAALAHVRLTDLAAHATDLVRRDLAGTDPQRSQTARISTGSIYQLWPTQADFQAELLFHVAELQAELTPSAEQILAHCRAGLQRGVPFSQGLAELLELIFDFYRNDPLFRIELSFLVAATDPRVAAALAHRRRRFSEQADRLWAEILDTYGRRLRPPYRVADLTTTVACHITGAVALWWADPGSLSDPYGVTGVSLAARTAALTVETMTEPANPTE